MSVPYPLNNNPLPARGENLPGDVPTKAFRAAPAIAAPTNSALTRLRSLYEDRKDWNRSLITVVLMFLMIAVSVLGKAPGTYAGLAVLVISILLVSATDAWAGLLLFLVYTSLEGMFKYTSLFSTAVYVIAPCLGIYIFVTWRLAIRAREAKAQAPAQQKISAFVSQKEDKGIPLPQLSYYVFALILLIFVQVFNPDAAGFVGALAGSIVWYLAPISLFFVAYYSVRNSKQLMAYLYFTVAISFVLCAYAMVQYFLGETWCYTHISGMESVNKLQWFNVSAANTVESGVFRPPSTTSIAGGYVGFGELGILAVILMSQMDKMPVVRRVMLLIAGFVMAVAVAMAGIRSIVLILIFMVPVTLFLAVRSFKDATRIYFFSFFVVAATLSVYGVANILSDGKIGRRLGLSVFNPVKSYQKNRGYHFVTLAEAIAIRPMGIGIQRGVGNWKQAQRSGLRKELLPFANRETQFNSLQADMGILGIGIFSAFLVAIMVTGYRYTRVIQHPRLRLITVYFLSVIVATFVACFGGSAIQGNTVFWVTCGLLLAVPRIYAAENKFVMTGEVVPETVAVAGPPPQ